MVDKLDAPQGESVELDRVLMISDDDKTFIGSPTVVGARVIATSHGMMKGKKVVVFRYKNKTRHRRKTGFRAQQTRLTIDRVVLPGE